MNSHDLRSKLWEALTKKEEQPSPWKTGEKATRFSGEGEYPESQKVPDSTPIEPESSRVRGLAGLKWALFALAVLYFLVSAYHVSLLTSMGRFLVVEQPPVKSDLIVCLAGGNVQRGLTAADLYRRGFAPVVFVAREEIPEGYDTLNKRGVSYPESIDLMVRLLKELGVPESAILTSDTPSESTVMEASIVSGIVEEKNFRSLILVTSPTHSRRAYLVFRKAMAEGVRILVVPSSYNRFTPEGWWKDRKYAREVLFEYQKLAYSFMKGDL